MSGSLDDWPVRCDVCGEEEDEEEGPFWTVANVCPKCLRKIAGFPEDEDINP